MPETEQQQAAAPAANDTSTSWNLGDFAKGFGSPLTKNENGTYNIAGALLTGAGTGLAAWFLSRVLGIKSGPSLGISILAGLAGAHGAFTKQGGLDFFSNPKGYLKDFMDKKREGGAPIDRSLDGGNTKEEDYNAAMEQNMASENSANQQLNYLRDKKDIEQWSQEPISPELLNAPDSILQQKMSLGKNSKEAIQAARVLQQRVKDRASGQARQSANVPPQTVVSNPGGSGQPPMAVMPQTSAPAPIPTASPEDIQASRQKLNHLNAGIESRYNYLIKNNPDFRSAIDRAQRGMVKRDLPMTSGEDNWYKAEDMFDNMNALKPWGTYGRYPGNNNVFPNNVEFSPIGTPLSRR